MPNLRLTKSELTYLQRLIGHHCCDNTRETESLYDKIADLAETFNCHSESPLPLRLAHDSMGIYNGRLCFSMESESHE